MITNKDFLKQWRESGREELLAVPTPDTIDDATRSIDVVWFTGAAVPRYDWWSDSTYTLQFNLDGADLSYLNNKAPVCDNHRLARVQDQLGAVVRAWRDANNFLARLQFSMHTDLDRLWDDIKRGIVSKFSMGVELLQLTDKRDGNDKLITRTADVWRPFELSVAPIPADWGTATLKAEKIGPPPNIDEILARAAHAYRARQIALTNLR